MAVATGNQTDSRGSLISVDSNPSNSDRNSEKMDGCEKVRGKKKSLDMKEHVAELDIPLALMLGSFVVVAACCVYECLVIIDQ